MNGFARRVNSTAYHARIGRGLARAWVRLFVLTIAIASLGVRAPGAPVRLTEEDITVPTYLLGDPEPNPIFYQGRGSQGAQGRVYPYPLYDSLTSVKSNKTYRIVYLENDYVRIGILPEIGGRLFEAIDKSNGYNFVYRQHVIKPALIGLIGAWISGGVEWNIPHHHRATTALPVQYHLSENADGSKTVWVGELELRHRMRWAVGYTLRPGHSYLECSVRISNRTPFVNTMLCFANVAVHVNNQYQVVYPPHTRFVTFHSKHEFTTWPVATTRYAGADFTQGVDVSWYSNHISANSMFAWNYQDDFFAGYDHGRQAGILSFADHHVVPGKKFWTWGNGPRGRMWDHILTDTDGPYIELMVGAYSDNQPDYSWLQPHETKSVEMYWYPFREIGGVKAANLEAALNLEVSPERLATLGVCATSEYGSATARLKAGTNILLQETIAIGPAKPYRKQISLPAGVTETDLRASLTAGGHELVAYSPEHLVPEKMPDPVQDPPAPKDIQSSEELYLAGQRIEQFHSPNREPDPYWQEALRRDPDDARVNIAVGIRLLKQARFTEAETHLRTALRRLTRNYTAPKDGEAFYYLGLALQGRALTEPNGEDILGEAADAFFKASWSQAWRGPSYYSLAELASRSGQTKRALEYTERALESNALDLRALNLHAALLRHSGHPDRALAVLDTAARVTDPLDTRLKTERWLAGDSRVLPELQQTVRQFPATGLETAAEYANAGLWADGIAVLELMTPGKPRLASPLAFYYLGEFQERLGHAIKAAEYRRLASEASPEYVFPFQWEMIPVLRHAIERNPGDARAAYYLGNLLFDWQPGEARRLWEQSAAVDPSFAIVHRNLALAYAQQSETNDSVRAIAELEKAVADTRRYALHFTELDELYAKTGVAPEKRLAVLRENHDVVSMRDDALSREIGLLVFDGDYDRALELMTGRCFSVWEGGSLDVTRHWVAAHLLRGQERLDAGNFSGALADFEQAGRIPENLPNDSERSGRMREVSYWTGIAWSKLGEDSKATAAWREAVGPSELKPTRGVNEAQVQLCFASMARKRLGQAEAGDQSLRQLLETAQEAAKPKDQPGAATKRHNPTSEKAQAHYLAGLCQTALGGKQEAKAQFELALVAQPDFAEARAELGRTR